VLEYVGAEPNGTARCLSRCPGSAYLFTSSAIRGKVGWAGKSEWFSLLVPPVRVGTAVAPLEIEPLKSPPRPNEGSGE